AYAGAEEEQEGDLVLSRGAPRVVPREAWEQTAAWAAALQQRLPLVAASLRARAFIDPRPAARRFFADEPNAAALFAERAAARFRGVVAERAAALFDID